MPAATRRPRRARVDLDGVRTLALALPGVEEATSYGTPAFRVRGRLFARLHQDGDALVVRADVDQREALVRAEPDAFFVTDHYRDHPFVLVRLSAVSRARLGEVLEQAWRESAPARLVAAFEAGD